MSSSVRSSVVIGPRPSARPVPAALRIERTMQQEQPAPVRPMVLQVLADVDAVVGRLARQPSRCSRGWSTNRSTSLSSRSPYSSGREKSHIAGAEVLQLIRQHAADLDLHRSRRRARGTRPCGRRTATAARPRPRNVSARGYGSTLTVSTYGLPAMYPPVPSTPSLTEHVQVAADRRPELEPVRRVAAFVRRHVARGTAWLSPGCRRRSRCRRASRRARGLPSAAGDGGPAAGAPTSCRRTRAPRPATSSSRTESARARSARCRRRSCARRRNAGWSGRES